MKYSAIERQQMLIIAREAILHGIHLGTRIELDLEQYPSPLLEQRACFVTLKRGQQLRGCIGSLYARESLAANIAHNAYSAAFSDPRFDPITAEELPQLTTEIAVLSDSEPLSFNDEDSLLAQLQPGRDGLTLLYGDARATFLPSVWEQLPEPRDFLRQLKIKAGLAEDFWSEQLQAERYQVQTVSRR